MSLNRHNPESHRHHPVVVADVGCGCGGSGRRNKSKLSSLFSSRSSSEHYILPPDPNPKLTNPLFSPSTTSTSTSTTLTTNSLCSLQSYSASEKKNNGNRDYNSKKKEKEKEEEDVEKKKRLVSDSVAVVKDSEDPYRDFKDCMLIMIIEKELHRWEDLRELLHELLDLNSPENHHVILRAFSDLCSQLFSPPASSSGETRRRER